MCTLKGRTSFAYNSFTCLRSHPKSFSLHLHFVRGCKPPLVCVGWCLFQLCMQTWKLDHIAVGSKTTAREVFWPHIIWVEMPALLAGSYSKESLDRHVMQLHRSLWTLLYLVLPHTSGRHMHNFTHKYLKHTYQTNTHIHTIIINITGDLIIIKLSGCWKLQQQKHSKFKWTRTWYSLNRFYISYNYYSIELFSVVV